MGAYGGSSDVMSNVAPLGDVYQAGTLSGNPIATAAGLTQLRLLDASAYERLEIGAKSLRGLCAAFRNAGIDAVVPQVGPILSIFSLHKYQQTLMKPKRLQKMGNTPSSSTPCCRGVALSPVPMRHYSQALPTQKKSLARL